MPARTLTPRHRWVDAGLDALATGGPDGIRVEALAARLGVTKGGFYGHFADRPAFLAAMLDEWERRCTDAVLAEADAEGGDAAERLRRAGQLSHTPEQQRLDLAVREWARRDEEVAERLRQVDDRRMDHLRGLFATFVDDPDEVEARSTLLFALAVARPLMVARHPGRSAREAVSLAGELLLRKES
ncbi:TetR/AcrR family transcriptional regulator [Cellulosimicrobium protaetiae]|uniref:TetR/AcrR family transcriptional regulator n=1 Tax=Cellulosimicrobium protaetiae TaxID=2587808 RepID=A0A6M5UCA9_9MICO|nr:TetR/AcrR family transcriptional regulator [Cellulosimicrobium protaetiae]QJW35890.1 TetR/AcrR family transcriptional regulator [Cellulosimicrobium protaetiae]